MSRRLRSITNFFLANLAIADLCVGLFCVFPHLYLQLYNDWLLGEAMCKMTVFVHTLSYTASILILVVICTERYVAIIHPIACRRILTPARLMAVVAWAWLLAAGYSSPRLLWMKTVRLGNQTLCAPDRSRYDQGLLDGLTFGLLYVLPLAVMLALYSRISVALWRSSRGLSPAGHCHQHQAVSSLHVLRARRGVVRMLIAVVVTFAACNLPLHARKMWQLSASSSYDGQSAFSAVFTPLTFLATYLNAAIDPLLYAFMSRNFRRGARELLCGGSAGSGARRRLRSLSLLQRRGSSRSTANSSLTNSS
ncbi:trissin receptor-like [Schistocerca serialis cubense]|uniref:trissin receptor-like n=1 Tax=Schistocerca serialis cubense TaxID=2023355 RepID=UPI00214E4728|nr:trissin receptor-like [Schistocerca serialis cubense]